MTDRPQAFVIHEDDCEFEGPVEGTFGPVRWRTLVSGDRSPTDSLTLGVAEIAPGEPGQSRRHRHAQAEVYYVLSGEGKVEIAGEASPARPGTTLFIPGGAEHRAFNTGSEPLRLLYVFPSDSFGDVEYEFSAS